MPEAVTVLTWNLWYKGFESRITELAGAVRGVDPDIAAFQEVPNSQYAEASERFGFATSTPPLPEQDWGNVIMSRWAITRHEAAVMRSSADSYRTVVAAEIAHPNGPLWIFTTHLTFGFDQSAERQRQVATLAGFVSQHVPAKDRGQSDYYPPVLVGDFNAEPMSDEVRMLTGRTTVPIPDVVFHDAWEVVRGGDAGFTWSNDNPYAAASVEPSRRIDYVFVGRARETPARAGEALDIRLVGTEEPASDHYGLVAQLAAP